MVTWGHTRTKKQRTMTPLVSSSSISTTKKRVSSPVTRVEKYFQLAAKVAVKSDDRRHYRIGAVGVRDDGTIVSSSNTECHHPQRFAHAEARLVKKLDQGSVVYVVRILRNGQFVNAKPCLNCQASLRRRGVKRVVYSIGESHYGVIQY